VLRVRRSHAPALFSLHHFWWNCCNTGPSVNYCFK